MKRGILCCVLLLLAIWIGIGTAEDGIVTREFPAVLQFTQANTAWRTGERQSFSVTLPHTAREDVDREVTGILETMRDEGMARLKKSRSDIYNRLDVGAYITRTGDRWMSFLMIGRVTDQRVQMWIEMDTRVYNMETGERILLSDIIREDAWERLSAEVRGQLEALFPEDADGEKLDVLCSREGLCRAGMTISPGHLSLIWRADQLYPEHPDCLMRAEIYVPEMYDLMTDEARTETDCTGYALVALTFDDGPRRGTTDALISQLQVYGGEYTFFVIGNQIAKEPQILHREYDAGYSVQSHTWNHNISGLTREKLTGFETKMNQEMSRIIGTKPKMMRAPGGKDPVYQKLETGLPLIRWSVISGDVNDSPEKQKDTEGIRIRVLHAGDGDIVLLHDTNDWAADHAKRYLAALAKRSVMLVTVDDLCALRGIPLMPGTEILRCPPDP